MCCEKGHIVEVVLYLQGFQQPFQLVCGFRMTLLLRQRLSRNHLAVHLDVRSVVVGLSKAFPAKRRQVPHAPSATLEQRGVLLVHRHHLDDELPPPQQISVHGLLRDLRHGLFRELDPSIALAPGGSFGPRQPDAGNLAELGEVLPQLWLHEAVGQVRYIEDAARLIGVRLRSGTARLSVGLGGLLHGLDLRLRLCQSGCLGLALRLGLRLGLGLPFDFAADLALDAFLMRLLGCLPSGRL
mmetsp:Transcript_31821/g.93032  ORF Transcript_31821/g.93032 Transcript_31821/m.93032 type:complete len:241 (+) Transcript_31821:309-1031(+)